MKYETRISKVRTKLETVIPLNTPYIVFLDPSDLCNFQCKFCPNGDRERLKGINGRNFGPMDFNLYKKFIDDLTKFPNKIKVLRLFKDGEPLLNKRFPDMVKYAKEKQIAEKIDTTTNASLLTNKLADALIDSGIDQINISIEGTTTEEYKDFTKCKINFDTFYSNIKYLYDNRKECHILIKINEDEISEESKQRFLDLFGPISDGIYLEHTISCWPTFDLKNVNVNKDVGIYGQPIKEVAVCPYVFYSIAINSNGDISVCFLDWERKLVIGNIKNSNIADIWNGEEMNNYRKLFLSGKRKSHEFCGQCNQLSQGMPDNIDEFKNDLLKRF